MSEEWDMMQELKRAMSRSDAKPTAQILDVDTVAYHNDPCEEISLSSSIAKILIERSPMHAYAAHARLGGERFKRTEAMDRGTLIHRLVLEAGAEIEEIDACDYKTNVAKDAKRAAVAAGRIPVLTEVLAEAKETARILRDRLWDFGVRFDGRSEVAVAWRERVFTSDATVQCRCMMDHLIVDHATVFDIKTIANAHPEACAKAIYNYGYDIQHAAYTSALRALLPGCEGREDMVFLFVETDPPHAVLPVRLDGQFVAMGQARWQRAVTTWRHCVRENDWPGYAIEPARVSPPGWAAARELP